MDSVKSCHRSVKSKVVEWKAWIFLCIGFFLGIWVALRNESCQFYSNSTPQILPVGFNLRKNESGSLWHKDLLHQEPRCQRTLISPFRVGCPADCTSRRKDISPDEDMYRLSIAWHLGEPGKYVMNESLQRHLFLTPPLFTEVFTNATSDIRQYTQSYLPELRVKTQRAMHLSLSYLCCLRAHEAKAVHPLFTKWVKSLTFDFTMWVTDLQCWQERYNSITNILVVDEDSQRRLMRYNHAFRDYLQAHHVPVVVPREEQMPFHLTLAGVHLGSEDECLREECNITRYLGGVSKMVQRIKGHWFPMNFPLHIDQDPDATKEIKKHN